MSNFGKFYVSKDLIDTHPQSFSKVLSHLQFIPTHVNFEYAWSKFLYVGLSPLFDEVVLGEEIPEYTFVITEVGPNVSIQVSKVSKT